VPQAAATLAVTLIGFEIGLFGASLVNAVLVLILVSIVVGALLAQRVVGWVPAQPHEHPPLAENVLVVTPAACPSDAAVRTATLLARPDGGHSDVLITRKESEPRPDRAALRVIEKQIFSQGFDGHVRTAVDELRDAVAKAVLAAETSLVVVDDPTFEISPGTIPVVVVGGNGSATVRVIANGDNGAGVAAEVERRLARGEPKGMRRRRPRAGVTD
jgi:hypothetical protein